MSNACPDISATLLSINWLEWARTIFDLLKGISWPLAAFGIIWIFRRELGARIKDVISLGPSGAVLQPAQPAQPATPASSNALTIDPHPLKTVTTLQARIEDDLSIFNDDARLPILIKNLAEARVERAFEFVFGAIFGSQIEALRELRKVDKLSLADAKKYFEEHVKPIDEELYTQWDFNQWSEFLLGQNLIEMSDGQVIITDFGRDFVTFVDVNRSTFKKQN